MLLDKTTMHHLQAMELAGTLLAFCRVGLGLKSQQKQHLCHVKNEIREQRFHSATAATETKLRVLHLQCKSLEAAFPIASSQVRSQTYTFSLRGSSEVENGGEELELLVPVQNYSELRSENSYIGGSLHDLNTANSPPACDIDSMEAVDRDAVTEESLNHDEDPNNVEFMNESYGNAIELHGVGVEEDRSSLESNGSLRISSDMLTINDVLPIETARARFLQIIVDHFINEHVVEVPDSETEYTAQPVQDKLNKRRSGEVQYEGDPRFVLPLMYVANMYETLVNEVNTRLATLNGFREKTIGVALEAAGGLYRKLAKKFPRKGPYTFKRRELATSLETRTRFPELVVQEEKRVRFVVVNGLDIVEKPNTVPVDDVEWFKRLTGRNEVVISALDYKFYSPRHKYRRVTSNSLTDIPGLPSYPGTDNSSPMSSPHNLLSMTDTQSHQQTSSKHHTLPLAPQPQFQSIQQNHHQSLHQNQQGTNFSHSQQCGHPSRLPDITHGNQSPAISQNLAALQSLAGSHIVGRLHMMPTSPAKFCDECGSPFQRETSKFCSQCGLPAVKRASHLGPSGLNQPSTCQRLFSDRSASAASRQWPSTVIADHRSPTFGTFPTTGSFSGIFSSNPLGIFFDNFSDEALTDWVSCSGSYCAVTASRW
ncbi:hypothetical protein Nepgr_025792 [Nepenthes gracilis]|uniref:Uncharacterized protein n=1 Tax=Nepenthes gracilis TaxID=150966 RepID=A0AAD3T770_NEPGR|nr:hypothetical protein Nepgr_025792 [Nepenthes gracilis]